MALSLDAMLARLEQLLDERAQAPAAGSEGHDNFRCEDCEACTSCRFCRGCVRCDECTYCEGCVECSACNQSKGLAGCVSCSHSSDSRGCERCHYVAWCIECVDCVQCFACVGIADEEFCILNERYTKKAYFEEVARLRELIATRVAVGWQPPEWLEFPAFAAKAAAVAPDPIDEPTTAAATIGSGAAAPGSPRPLATADTAAETTSELDAGDAPDAWARAGGRAPAPHPSAAPGWGAREDAPAGEREPGRWGARARTDAAEASEATRDLGPAVEHPVAPAAAPAAREPAAGEPAAAGGSSLRRGVRPRRAAQAPVAPEPEPSEPGAGRSEPPPSRPVSGLRAGRRPVRPDGRR